MGTKLLKLTNILQEPDLGLKLVTVRPVDKRLVTWAHVSELEDPTPWLVGGELLLTTGLTLFNDLNETRFYCERLVEKDVAALGISTGRSLPHNEIPEHLTAAANNAGLDIVQVPESTPLQSVVRYVSDAISERHSEPLKRALVAQRQLSEAAVAPEGVASVLRVLDANTGFSSAVYDPTFRLINATNHEPQQVFDDHREEIRKLIRGGPHWSISTDHDGQYSVITPLNASDNLRGMMVTVKQGPLSEHDQAILSTVFSLLRVLLELRHAAAQENRRLRARVVEALVTQQLSSTAAELHLARIEAHATRLQCLTLPTTISAAQTNSLLSGIGDYCHEVLLWERPDELVMLICDPEDELMYFAPAYASELEIRHGGLGSAVGVTDGGLSLRQARKARQLAAERDTNLIVFPHVSSYKALLLLGDAAARSAFADEVLHPLDIHDQTYGTDLIQVLQAYLMAVGNIETAATDIGIHRHTMRARLAKISDLTRRNLKVAADLLELWLAIEFREV